MRKMIAQMAAVLAVAALSAGTAVAADKLTVKDATGTNTVFKVDDTGVVAGKKLAMGTDTPQSAIHLNWPDTVGTYWPVGTALYSVSTGFVISTQNNSPALDLTAADNTGTAGYRGTFRGVRSRGTLTAPLAAAENDQVLSLIAGVYDGTAVRNTAQVTFAVDGPVATNVAPVRIALSTKPSGSTWYERLTIKSGGNVGIGAPTPTALLHVGGDTIRLQNPKTPASSSAACNQGDISWDANYVYVCVATNQWKRAALGTF